MMCLQKGWVLREFKTSQNTARSRSTHKLLLTALGTLALNSPVALAQEPDAKNALEIKPNPTAMVTNVCNRQDTSGFDAMIYATCYSERYQAVVVLVSGNAGDMSGKKIGAHIVKEFGAQSVPAVYFIENPERDKVAISYFLNGDFYGPFSGETWKEGKQTLTVHSAQAWYQTRN